ncbi:hypothetical protein P175DRAFT_0527312 [Aspergillus ochraceoroseus IBT 24754]|uniref:Zn(2)-C6 fungal-type domain-containing protein n=1 Tax=Aspergillus ochraceoroseus IBT 24754 TaxID=1392256 RepID=A0A2T5M5P8_9EURO|nr:uncharacterized protein P175DRAFT_0527312 [Aspergillus ochraceoroseus IBT 24754]PTU23858.1 hypothetical protein P175DRAFT_0527312 [Aspergillus ochraceoroseus IBT 24754]
MVGVPGRSKACVTCLRRKKRCDLQKPRCGPCRKACIECGGYYRPRIFINNTVQNPDTKVRTMGASCELRHDTFGKKAGRNPIAAESVALLPSLARSAYQTKYLDLFWNLYLPNGVALSPEVTQPTLGGWIGTIQEIYSTEEVLRKALLAMSLAAVGKHDGSQFLKEEGMELYAGALQGMAVALKNPKRALSDGMLTAIRIFSLYESMHGNNDASGLAQARSWVVHNSGDVALLMARTPHSFTTGHAHRLFADGRLHLTLSALRTRKRTFLAEPAWMAIPWSQQEKSPRDHLIDILIDITPVFEDMDIMKSCEHMQQKEALRQQLIARYLDLQQRLVDWNTRFAPDFEPTGECPEVILPSKLAAAHLSTLLWSTQLVVAININLLLHTSENSLVAMDLDRLCGNIVKTIPFFCHPSVGLFRVHLTTYPLSVALQYICDVGAGRMVAERRLLVDCLDNPACVGMRQFITSMNDNLPGFLQ